MLLSNELEFYSILILIQEVIKSEDQDDNGSVFMKDFTFFNYSCDHILNAYHYNIENFVDVISDTDRFLISYFDYAEWYYYKYTKVNFSNNSDNILRYYCSSYTGPAWSACRSVAGSPIGSKKGQSFNSVYCEVEKVSETLLRYTEKKGNSIIPLNNGAGYLSWQFEFERS